VTHAALVVLIAVVSAVLTPPRETSALAEGGPPTTHVYFDQREEQDMYTYPNGLLRQGSRALIPPWDPNGQMCLHPDGSGRFVTGYNPTTPDQTETVGRFEPYKQPPVGEALWDRRGRFTGKSIYVPGSYNFKRGTHAVTGRRASGDTPPDETGSFHTYATFTGCAFNRKGVLFAADIGTAQGEFPPPDSGRIIQWFPPSYTTYCILLGPTQGGIGPHHIGGTGGLRDPAAGAMAIDGEGDVLVPLPFADGFPPGNVVKLDHSTLPRSGRDCPGPSNAPRKPVKVSTFIQGQIGNQPTPVGIARDPKCKCWAVSSIFGSPSIAWYDDAGTLLAPGPAGKGPVVGGGFVGTFNPLGLAFATDGTLFFIDVHLTVGPGGIGPEAGQGALYQVTFTNGIAGNPTAIATGLDYPVSVTTCTPAKQICPAPRR
jgi:hypothetical protein